MALPNVNVNVQEETLLTNNSTIPFVPAVLIKTKSGPIGTIETVTSESQFKALFGDSDYTVPSAYAIQTYLRSYAYVLVLRLANETEAAKGIATIAAVTGEDNEQVTTNLVKAETNYKTDLFNGKEIKLVYDGTNHKLWFDLSAVTGKNTISIKESFTADTAKADELEVVLNKLITSVNLGNFGFTMTNLFVNKTASDPVPAVEAYANPISAYITGGNSGNSTPIDETKVKEAITKFDLPDRNIDVMVIPEYSTNQVINHATELALKNNFIVLSGLTGNTVEEAEQSAKTFNIDNRGSLVFYYPDVYYRGFVNSEGNQVPVPISMAVLHVYARNDIRAKWGAPAGVNRGTLSLVDNLVVPLTEDMISTLYDAEVPVNSINNISGRGYIVWGNKTATGNSPFFDRINVARLVKYVTRQAYNISWEYLFEPISDAVFAEWTARMSRVLRTIKDSYGISAYQVIMDDTINTPETIAQNQLNGIIRIKPQEVAEYINIDLRVTDTIEVTVE